MYVPGGILKHHHACQFLSFRAPAAAPIDPAILAGHYRRHHHHYGRQYHPQRSLKSGSTGFLGLGTLLGTSSFDDMSSQLSNPSDVLLLPNTTRGTKQFHSSSSSGFSGPGMSLQPLNSKWRQTGPVLEVVGEATKEKSKVKSKSKISETEKAAQEATNPQPNKNETKKKEKHMLVKLVSAVTCSRRCIAGEGKKGDDAHSSSRGGDGSRSNGGKVTGKNNNGRVTPDSTSGGSGDGGEEGDDTFLLESSMELEELLWQKSNWEGMGKIGEECSIVSESAPLLTRLPLPSSSSVSSSQLQRRAEKQSTAARRQASVRRAMF
jgi:hypothetical protein